MISQGQLRLRDYLRSFNGDYVSCEWDVADPLPFLAQWPLIPYLAVKRGY